MRTSPGSEFKPKFGSGPVGWSGLLYKLGVEVGGCAALLYNFVFLLNPTLSFLERINRLLSLPYNRFMSSSNIEVIISTILISYRVGIIIGFMKQTFEITLDVMI